MDGTAHLVGANQAFYDEFESYRFSDDPEFRSGLPTVIAAIRGKDRNADQIDEMIGRAQWFYFTRLKGVSIPWEEYARHQATPPFIHPNSPTLSPKAKVPRSPREALQALNNLAEARTMMQDGTRNGQEIGEGEGLSFAMLSRLISEGRAGEVHVKQIPEGTNESQPSQPMMKARPKPWETTGPVDSSAHPQIPYSQGQSMGNGQTQGQISPTLLQYQPHPSYSSSINSSSIYNQAEGSSRSSYDAIYNPQWSSTGPTISPDLSFESFNLDPDFTSLQSGPSSGLTTNTGSVGTPFDDSSIGNYLNVDYDPNTNTSTNEGANAISDTYSITNPINLAPPIPSPGAFQSSNSTPATEHVPPDAGQEWTTENTPASSYSL